MLWLGFDRLPLFDMIGSDQEILLVSLAEFSGRITGFIHHEVRLIVLPGRVS